MQANERAGRPLISGTPVKESKIKVLRGPEGLTVEQLLTAALLDLKATRPFFYAALCVLPRVESADVDNIAVSPGKLYYNSSFVASLTRAQLVYYYIHSIYHVVMKHHLRGKGRDAALWNIACDLYINKCISDEYGIMRGGPAGEFDAPGRVKMHIQFPERETLDTGIDIDSDTPEKLYAILLDIRRHSGADPYSVFSINSRKGGSMKRSGDLTIYEEWPIGHKPLESAKVGEEESETGREESAGESRDAASTRSAAAANPDENMPAAEPEAARGERRHSESKQDKRMDRGGAPRPRSDIVDDAESRSKSFAVLEQQVNRLLEKINTVHGQVLLSNAGYGRGGDRTGVAEAFAARERIPRISWYALVQSRLVNMTVDEKSLSTPDKRFVHRGLYVEGRASSEDRLDNVKICIDTSASMSDMDVSVAAGQISSLIKRFSVRAELVFWDEDVEDIVPFEGMLEFQRAKQKATGRGGTDPNCIFARFYLPDYRLGKKPKPDLLIIFTDGFFDPPQQKFAAAFGRNTIWVLCGKRYKTEFVPGFGKIVKFKKEE